MRRALVYNKDRLAGYLEERDDGTYRFRYDEEYLADDSTGPVSLTLPKRPDPFVSEHLFAFFYGLLAEGSTRRRQCRRHKIDEDDHFGLLLATGRDTIGSVTIETAETPDD
jgi:serine/threonine-protein kinase HipA